MAQIPRTEVSKLLLVTLNNLYEIERKLKMHGDIGNALRNVHKIKESFKKK